MKIVADGFNVLEKQAARMTISEKSIVEKANATTNKNEITKLDEMCLVRGYNISKIASKYKSQDLVIALTEGGATGAFGFAGLPANLVLSIFIYYRAVQSIAMIYEYDVKNDDAEMLIASDVLMNSLSPGSKESDEINGIIGRVILHWFTGRIQDLEEAIDRGYYFSINPKMIKSKSGVNIVSHIPVQRILLESDAPFIAECKNEYTIDFNNDIYNYFSNLYGVTYEQVMMRVKANFAEVIKKDNQGDE